ncbi:putative F-box/FBD/LRR-repeat protein [Cardamine amara subsp. amara]|uniref:F-box/FBD/LRR-repeat protein n=1 Tax=Cardamine amara subsp. amara TaxID=228776 RepID=A0ABD1AXY2_CARAN
MDDKLMGSLTPVKRLSLALYGPYKLKLPTGNILYRLVYLELYTYTPVWLNALTLMLDASPKMQVLKLIDHNSWCSGQYYDEEWNQPKNVPECLLLHLETFMWEGYKCGEK